MYEDPQIVREGDATDIHFYLQDDTTGDGKVDAAINLTGATTITLRLKKHLDGTVKTFSLSSDPALVVVDATGGSTTINGIAASHIKLTPKADSFLFADEGYKAYIEVVDGVGVLHTIPNAKNKEVLVLAKF